jgi:four helix bundle protein
LESDDRDPEIPPGFARPGERDVAASDLIALRNAHEAAGTAIRLVTRVPTPLKPIADQIIRSASSVPANLAEDQGRSPDP